MGQHASPVERTRYYILFLRPSTTEASLDPRFSWTDAFPVPAGVVDVAVQEHRHPERHYILWSVRSTGEA